MTWQKDWEEIRSRAEADGFTAAEYDAARLWFLADTQRLDADRLEAMAAAGHTAEYAWNAGGLGAALSELLHFFDDEPRENLAWPGTLFLLLLIICLGEPGRSALQALLTVLESAAAILLFLMIGRAPLRLLQMVFMACTLAFAQILLRGGPGRRTRPVRLCAALLAALLAFASCHSLVQAIRAGGLRAPQTALLSRAPAENGSADGGGFVTLWEDWYAGVGHALMDAGRLAPPELLVRHLPAGDWSYGQPYFAAFLKEMGTENPARALLEHEDMYLATADAEYLQLVLAFLSEGAGRAVTAVPAGSVRGCPRYRLQTAEASAEP